jgi:uncharacterized protein (DUF433 family)
MPTILEDYFDFSEPEEIRIQGHRVWLHHVLFDYLGGASFEKLCENFHTLSKDQILACLLYYHRNQESMDKYLADLKALFEKRRQESFEKHGDWIGELRRRKAAMDAAQSAKESA